MNPNTRSMKVLEAIVDHVKDTYNVSSARDVATLLGCENIDELSREASRGGLTPTKAWALAQTAGLDLCLRADGSVHVSGSARDDVRERLHARQEQLQAPRRGRKKRGRPPKYTDEQREEALARYRTGENVAIISIETGIPANSIYTFASMAGVKRARARKTK